MCTFMYASVLRVFKSFRISCACDRRDQVVPEAYDL